MKYLIHIAAIFAACVTASGAALGQTQLSKQFSACYDRTNGTTARLQECYSEEYKQQDGRLNRVYKEVMGQLSASRKKALQDAQVVWIKYKEANCNFYNDPDGAARAGLLWQNCIATMTAVRADELERMKSR